MSKSLENNKEQETSKAAQEKLLEKLATEELLREACQGAIRVEAIGPSGWLKNKNPKTNKTFLKNTLRNAISSNDFNFKRKEKYLNSKRKDYADKTSEDKSSLRYKPYKKY